MRKHNGMRPQDIVILLKLVVAENENKQLARLSHSLFISLSEVSESLHRSQAANLLDYDKKKVMRQNLLEFLEHGVRYVFPQKPGAMVRGLPTAHSHPFMKKTFTSNTNYVWPDTTSQIIGMQIEPFYIKQVQAAKEDAGLYKLLALVDVTRVGKVREIKLAVSELEKIILCEP
jgi:hypothetical protein